MLEPYIHYLAYSTTLVSLTRFTFICPGYSISFSTFLATSLAKIVICSSDILSGFTIKSSFIDYHCYENIYYSPSSFSVIEEIYTVNEAAEKWGMSEGTLRNAIKTDKFIEKVEWRKAGRITLISEKAMKRVYGEPKANNN